MRHPAKLWLLISATLVLFSASVYADDSQLRGVWKGSLGKQDIMVCFDNEESGEYYYLHYLSPLQLAKKKGEPQWEETGKTVTGIWSQLKTENNELTGQWQKPGDPKTVPIRLSRVVQTTQKETEAEGYLEPACESDAYVTKLKEVQQKVISGKPENYHGIPYRRLGANLFSTDRVESIEILDGSKPTLAINKLLRDAFQNNINGYFECKGINRFYSFASSVDIVFIDKNWLSIREWSSGDCGGAYPFSDSSYRNFDRVQGKEVNVWTFFKNARNADASLEYDAYYFNFGASESLNKTILSYYKARKSPYPNDIESDKECQEAVETNKSYKLALSKNGIVFSTPFPHVKQACDEDIEVPYKKLLPFMTEAGKKVAKLLMEAR
ncbi:MAG: hypothetical protein Q8L15_11050 [Methylobacter sp.]|nr:hypothetical protein [Methylobacter sp.]